MTMNWKPIALAAVLCSAALAQGPGQGTPPDPATMAQRRVNMLAAQLTLTDAQKASALTIFTNAITSAESIQTSLQSNRASMKTAIQNNDTATISQLASA